MGHELFKHYSTDKQPFLTFGLYNEWSVYNGMEKTKKIPVCIFCMSKKIFKKKFPKTRKKELVSKCKEIPAIMSKYPSQRILKIIEPIHSNKNYIGFVTESFSYSLRTWLESKKSKIEIKSIVIEICKAINYCHNEAHLIFNNLNIDNIFITNENNVKFGFLEHGFSDPAIEGINFEINTDLQNLKFISPEIVLNKKCHYSSDIYSFGLVIYYILSKKFLFNLENNTIDEYKKIYTKIKNNFNFNFENEDNNLLKKILIEDPKNRPDIQTLMNDPWFIDPKLKALNFIEHLDQNSKDKNAEFLKNLPYVLSQFDDKIIINRILPSLLSAVTKENCIVEALPGIFTIIENEKYKINFENEIWPKIKVLFTMRSIPAQCLYFLLMKIRFISSKISNSEFQKYFLKVITKSLDCKVTKIQTVVADNMDIISTKIDSLSFKTRLYPSLMNTIQTTNSQKLKIKLLNSMKGLYKILDQGTINENLLNNLDRVRQSDNSKEICMLIVNIYEDISKVVTTLSIANKILPSIISILVSGNISRKNFEMIMGLVLKYLDAIKKDRDKDLYDEEIGNNNNNLENLDMNFPQQVNPMPNLNDNNNSKDDNKDFLADFFGGDNNNKNNENKNEINNFLNNNNNVNDMNLNKDNTNINNFTGVNKENNITNNTNNNNNNLDNNMNNNNDFDFGMDYINLENNKNRDYRAMSMIVPTPKNDFSNLNYNQQLNDNNFNNNNIEKPKSNVKPSLDDLLNDLGNQMNIGNNKENNDNKDFGLSNNNMNNLNQKNDSETKDKNNNFNFDFGGGGTSVFGTGNNSNNNNTNNNGNSNAEFDFL